MQLTMILLHIFVVQTTRTYEGEEVKTFDQAVPHFNGQIKIIKPL